jgi:hypothetical protein
MICIKDVISSILVKTPWLQVANSDCMVNLQVMKKSISHERHFGLTFIIHTSICNCLITQPMTMAWHHVQLHDSSMVRDSPGHLLETTHQHCITVNRVIQPKRNFQVITKCMALHAPWVAGYWIFRDCWRPSFHIYRWGGYTSSSQLARPKVILHLLHDCYDLYWPILK